MLKKEHKLFAEEYVKHGYNASKAYKAVYNAEDNTCRSNGYKLLRNQEVIDEIKNVEKSYYIAGHKAGITRDAIVVILANIMQNAFKVTSSGKRVPDWTAMISAVQTYAKLADEIVDKKKVEIKDTNAFKDTDLSKLSKEERKELEKQLLDSLKRG